MKLQIQLTTIRVSKWFEPDTSFGQFCLDSDPAVNIQKTIITKRTYRKHLHLSELNEIIFQNFIYIENLDAINLGLYYAAYFKIIINFMQISIILF